ncbi:MAG: hypothetical protein AB7V20_14345 [Phycisphaerales bacterium]
MTTQPQWSSVDDNTADLLDLITMQDESEAEWQEYVTALRHVARIHGKILPNELRVFTRDAIKPQRIGAFTHRAIKQGLIRADGWEVSTDLRGRNSGKPARTYT